MFLFDLFWKSAAGYLRFLDVRVSCISVYFQCLIVVLSHSVNYNYLTNNPFEKKCHLENDALVH